jgi:hypothetical protein
VRDVDDDEEEEEEEDRSKKDDSAAILASLQRNIYVSTEPTFSIISYF